MSLIIDLIDGGFFKKPKGLSSIKSTLEEQGHYYPVTTLSPVVLRLVRKRQLRRIKDKKRWQYVG
jgi:predicted transcriptional regulator